MRIYSSLKEAYGEIQRDLVEMGTEVHPETMQDKDVRDDDNYITKELQGYCYSIVDFKRLAEDFEELGGNLTYANQEFEDRISMKWKNPGQAYKLRKEVWEPFLHNGRFSYTYNSRLREQFPIILEELKRNPNTRQAVLTLYDRHQDIENLGGKARIPCSMTYQLLLRKLGSEEKPRLDIIYTMRSCDIFTHLIYDIYITIMMQHHMAFELQVEPGRFIHFTGSLHAYKKDYAPKGIF